MSLTAIKIVGVVALMGYLALLPPVLRAARRRANRSFALFFLATLIWQAGVTGVSFSADPTIALGFYRITIALGIGISIFFALFSRDFLRVHSHRWIMWVGYFLFGALALWILLGGPAVIIRVFRAPETGLWLPDFGPLAYVCVLIVYIYIAYGAALLLRYHQRAASPLDRNRIRFLLFGLLLLVAGSLSNLSPALRPYPVDMVMNALFAFTIAYSILRYQLLDISVVVRKGLVYSMLTATIGVVYFLGVFLALTLFDVVSGYQIFLLSLFLAAVTAVAMQPLRDAMQGWLDKLFFREKYDAGLMLKRLSRTAASVLQIDRLTEMILDDVLATMHISNGAFFIKDEKGGDYRLRAYMGSDLAPEGLPSFRRDSPVITWLSGRQTALSNRVLETDPSFISLWTREREDLKRLRAELLVPLMAAGKLIGVLMLGPKLSEAPFSAEEQLTLDTLANQTAVAVENARLFSETTAEKERTATIVEQAFAGIILLDSDLRIVALNPAAEAIIGYGSAQAAGVLLRDVLGPGILNEKSSLRRAMTTGQRVPPKEETLVAVDRRRDVLLGVTPLRDGYLLSLADITQLKEVDRLKSDIVANVSHEFRTPLAIIKAYSELLMDDAQGGSAASRHEYLSVIDAETDRLTSMVSGLLDLARLEASRDSIVMAPVRLGDIIAEVVTRLQPQARARDLAIGVDIMQDLPTIQGNRELLIALVNNLLGNAIKFSRGGGRVDVIARCADNLAILQVSDNGIGMSGHDLEHLFEKFYRGSTAKAAGVRGTGLGLVLAKQAVEAHGGMISAESRLGYGTTFTVTLPVLNGGGLAQQSPGVDRSERLPDPALATSVGSLIGA
jgi:PAS domain S-box-containing protein